MEKIENSNKPFRYELTPAWKRIVANSIKWGTLAVISGTVGFPYFILSYPVEKIDPTHFVIITLFLIVFLIVFNSLRIIRYLKYALVVETLEYKERSLKMTFISDRIVDKFRSFRSLPDSLELTFDDTSNIKISETRLFENRLREGDLKFYVISTDRKNQGFVLMSEKEHQIFMKHLTK